MIESIFTPKEQKKFIDSVKTGEKKKEDILRNGISLEEAFIYGY